MSTQIIETKFCGVPLAWSRQDQEEQRYQIEFGPLSREVQVVSNSKKIISKKLSLPYLKESNAYAVSLFAIIEENYKMYTIKVICPELTITQINKAFRTVLYSSMISSFFTGLTLGLRFSAHPHTLARGVTKISYAVTALSILGFLGSCYKFQKESFDFANRVVMILNLANLQPNGVNAEVNLIENNLIASDITQKEYRFVWSSVFGW